MVKKALDQCGKKASFLLLGFLLSPVVAAQDAPTPAAPEKRSHFKDSVDGAFDVSGWLATRTGVLPILKPITQPAVGYGAALALVHFSGGGLAGAMKAPPGPSGKPIPPDIAVLAGAYTENGTWAVGGAYIGHWKDDQWRFKAAAGRIAPTLDYYDARDQAFEFTLDGWTLFQELGYRVGKTDLFAGLNFLWLDSTVSFSLHEPHPGIPQPSFDAKDVGLGPFVELDTRNNSLTPSSGFDLKAEYMFLGPWLGGDKAYRRYGGTARFYWDPGPRFVLSARFQGQAASGDVPFYAFPFIQLRGIPSMRYQGHSVLALDGEVRWNAWKRWWLVGFAGAGKTTDSPGLSKEGASVHAGGFGFRYLVARALGLHVGVDFAKGPEDNAFYIVTGSSF